MIPEKYEKYVDAKGRLIVILRTMCGMDDKHQLNPHTIVILDVNAEKEYSYPFDEVMGWIKDNLIVKVTQIPKYEFESK